MFKRKPPIVSKNHELITDSGRQEFAENLKQRYGEKALEIWRSKIAPSIRELPKGEIFRVLSRQYELVAQVFDKTGIHEVVILVPKKHNQSSGAIVGYLAGVLFEKRNISVSIYDESDNLPVNKKAMYIITDDWSIGGTQASNMISKCEEANIPRIRRIACFSAETKEAAQLISSGVAINMYKYRIPVLRDVLSWRKLREFTQLTNGNIGHDASLIVRDNFIPDNSRNVVPALRAYA